MSKYAFPDGVYPVAPTPMLGDGSIDEDGFRSCLDFYLQSESAGITILGSGGELPYLSDAEQSKLVEIAANQVEGSKPIIVGINAFSEHQALEKIQRIQHQAQAAMLLLHSYYDVKFNDLKNTLKAIASQVTIPILYYHFPQVSGLWLSPSQIMKLMEIDNIIGIKDSSLNNHAAKKILATKACANYFTALSLFMPSLYELGASKAICPLGAISPLLAHQVFKECRSSSTAENSDAFKRLVELLSITGNVEKKGSELWRLLKPMSRLPISLLKSASSPHVATKEALRLQGVPIRPHSRALSSGDWLPPTLSLVEAALNRAGVAVA